MHFLSQKHGYQRDSDKIWLQAMDLNKKDLNLFSSNRKEEEGVDLD